MHEPYQYNVEEMRCLTRSSISSRPFATQILPGNRRSTESLLPDTDDDDDTYVNGDDDMCSPHQNVAVSNLKGEQLNTNQIQEVDRQVGYALEIFPSANPLRIQYLLRSETLNTTLLILAQELTNGTPSDEVVGSIPLTYATTYAQASRTDQRFLLESLQEMFPKISTERIERTLMRNSTHRAVAILAESHDIPEGKAMNINSMDAIPKISTERIERAFTHNSKHQAVAILAESHDIPKGKAMNINSMDAIPKISTERIERAFTHNSKHQTVAILSESHYIPEGKKMNINSMDAILPLPKARRRNLTDSDDDSWRPNLARRR